MDISRLLVTKSDQLNADDLLAGPITVAITGVSVVAGEQPVIVEISGGHRPWKPCKTMMRLLGAAETWGPETAGWVGKRVTLFRDPEVNSPDGTKDVGGIRVSHMSDIKRSLTLQLNVKRGKKKAWHVAKLPDVVVASVSEDDLKRWGMDAVRARGWAREQVVELFGGLAAGVPPEKRAAIVDRLKGAPPAVAPVGDFDEPAALSDAEKADILRNETEGK